MEFSRQEYWSGLPRSPLGDLPDPGMAPWSPALQADSLPSEPPGKTYDMKGQVQVTSRGSVSDLKRPPPSLVAQRLKHLPAMWETWVQSLGQEDPLEKEMATHFSILAWRIPGTEEPSGLLWGRTESDTTEVT